MPQMEAGDAEILKEAAAKVDFMGVNYYQTTVVEYNPIDGVGASHEMKKRFSHLIKNFTEVYIKCVAKLYGITL